MAAPAIPPIRPGLIGTGLAVEKLHWPALRRLAGRYVVTAFTDRSAEQSRRFADYSGAGPARAAADRAALLARDDVDAVLISVPIPHLYEVARDALTAGKDVLGEKPTGVDAEQAAAFLALVAGHPDRTFVVGENFLYRDDLRYARALLDGGAIGRLHLMAWRHAGRLVPRGIDNGYRAELVDFADAVQFGVRPVGSVAQSVANAMVVQRALDSAERAAVLAPDPVPGAGPGTAVAAPWLDRAVRRAARTTHQQFGVLRRINDPQRGARLAVPPVATSPVGTRPLDRAREEWSWKTKRTGRGARSSG